MAREIISEIRQSVFAVIIERVNPQQGEQRAQVAGTGFFVSNDGYFVTADHVINLDHGRPAGRLREIKDKIMIAQIQPDGRSVSVVGPMQVVVENRTKDYAILKAPDTLPKVQKYLDIDLTARFEGEEVSICGYPLASSNQDPQSGQILLDIYIRVSAGILMCQRLDNLTQILEVDFPILPGNSGGPLIATTSRRVLGLATATNTVPGPNGTPMGMFGICTDIRELQEDLRNKGII